MTAKEVDYQFKQLEKLAGELKDTLLQVINPAGWAAAQKVVNDAVDSLREKKVSVMASCHDNDLAKLKSAIFEHHHSFLKQLLDAKKILLEMKKGKSYSDDSKKAAVAAKPAPKTSAVLDEKVATLNKQFGTWYSSSKDKKFLEMRANFIAVIGLSAEGEKEGVISQFLSEGVKYLGKIQEESEAKAAAAAKPTVSLSSLYSTADKMGCSVALPKHSMRTSAAAMGAPAFYGQPQAFAHPLYSSPAGTMVRVFRPRFTVTPDGLKFID